MALLNSNISSQTISVKTKNVYGNDLIYPVCDNARAFASLIGKKTFSKTELTIIILLGFDVIHIN